MRSSRVARRYFDSRVKTLQRDASVRQNMEASRDAEFLRREFVSGLVDRLDDIQGREFERVLDLGAGAGLLTRELLKRPDVKSVYAVEGSSQLWHRDGAWWEQNKDSKEVVWLGSGLDDAEWDARIPDGSLDLVSSVLSLHWCNEVDVVFERVARKLKPDRPFIGCIWGQETLRELRSAVVLAEMERCGGVARARMSPLAGPQDVANALGRAGLSISTLDTEKAQVAYASPARMLEDLFAMGERAAPAEPQALRKDALIATLAMYQHLFAQEPSTNVSCSFNAIWWIAWSYSEDQAKPKARGSAIKSLKSLSTQKPTDKQQ